VGQPRRGILSFPKDSSRTYLAVTPAKRTHPEEVPDAGCMGRILYLVKVQVRTHPQTVQAQFDKSISYPRLLIIVNKKRRSAGGTKYFHTSKTHTLFTIDTREQDTPVHKVDI
jgi:hypothetical protein